MNREVLIPKMESKPLDFDRDKILNRYWELANLDAESTKGTIAGQLKALDSLCEELFRTPAVKPKSPAQPQDFYRSEWRETC
jgi:hypothetical protein